MDRPARVVGVERRGGRHLRVTFDDRLVRELDFDDLLRGGVFADLHDAR